MHPQWDTQSHRWDKPAMGCKKIAIPTAPISNDLMCNNMTMYSYKYETKRIILIYGVHIQYIARLKIRIVKVDHDNFDETVKVKYVTIGKLVDLSGALSNNHILWRWKTKENLHHPPASLTAFIMLVCLVFEAMLHMGPQMRFCHRDVKRGAIGGAPSAQLLSWEPKG